MGAETEIRPWHDAPITPCCKSRIGCLRPYNPSGWYGPEAATLFCPACGNGWIATEDEIETALIAETWWGAFEDSNLSERQFIAAHLEEPVPCGKTCFRRGCQRPELHFGANAKLCPHKDHQLCGRCRFLLDRFDKRQRLAPPTEEQRSESP